MLDFGGVLERSFPTALGVCFESGGVDLGSFGPKAFRKLWTKGKDFNLNTMHVAYYLASCM